MADATPLRLTLPPDLTGCDASAPQEHQPEPGVAPAPASGIDTSWEGLGALAAGQPGPGADDSATRSVNPVGSGRHDVVGRDDNDRHHVHQVHPVHHDRSTDGPVGLEGLEDLRNLPDLHDAHDAHGTDDADRHTGRRVRPYTITGGRTAVTGPEIPLEAQVLTSNRQPVDPSSYRWETARLVEMVEAPMALVELAARLEVPVGVARVLVSDLVAEGVLIIHLPPPSSSFTSLLEQVLDGVNKL